MKHSIADFPGPVLATIGFPGLRHEDRIRFLSGLVLTGCGAVMFQSDLIARFATVAGGRGAADAERDIRGFAVNFCTEEGNWDN